MKKIFSFLLLALVLATLSSSKSTYIKCPYPYTRNMLALSWLGEFCSEHTCNDNFKNWDGQTITIHGFWPSPKPKKDNYVRYDLCRQKDIYQCGVNQIPAFEVFGYDYLWSNETQLREDLLKYWPETNSAREEGWFYEHEWDNHGVCYLQHMINSNQHAYELDKGAFSKEIFKEYFRVTIDLVKELNLKFKKNEEFQDKEALSEDIGIAEGKFTYQCNSQSEHSDRELNEIRICYSVADTPGNEQIIDCQGYENDECRISKKTDEFHMK